MSSTDLDFDNFVLSNIRCPVVVTSEDYAMSLSDYVVLAQGTTVTLPLADRARLRGKFVIIKNTSASATLNLEESGSPPVTIAQLAPGVVGHFIYADNSWANITP